eukprot:3011507-Amphidinium_carterae.1
MPGHRQLLVGRYKLAAEYPLDKQISAPRPAAAPPTADVRQNMQKRAQPAAAASASAAKPSAAKEGII